MRFMFLVVTFAEMCRDNGYTLSLIITLYLFYENVMEKGFNPKVICYDIYFFFFYKIVNCRKMDVSFDIERNTLIFEAISIQKSFSLLVYIISTVTV